MCLARRLARDIKFRGRELRGAIKQWMTFVKPNYELYVEPQKKNAGQQHGAPASDPPS